MSSDYMFSFIIPTLNEESHIKNTIQSIRTYTPNKFNYEIIVIDNGSTDTTVAEAQSMGIGVYIQPKMTIAGLRNFGAQKSSGGILVFLDGDVLLTKQWQLNIIKLHRELIQNQKIVTGSKCGVPENPTWIEKYWFEPLSRTKTNYMNSGHLLISKLFFEELRGFNSELQTAEDYDLSIRAVRSGGKIINRPELQVIHMGFPKTIIAFIKREVWHGTSDYRSFVAIYKSKVAIVSIVFLFLHFLSCIAVIKPLGWLYPALIALICIASSWIKFKKPIEIVLINSFIYYIYYWGRAMAFISLKFGLIRVL